MNIIEVSTTIHQKEFLLLPVRLYKNEKNWIRPLDSDIEEIFDKKKNKYFRHGECIRWLLIDDNKKTIGRVAAFIDKKLARKHDQPTGGMGFFECIDDKDAAFLLFDTCKKWLAEREMEAMDGPINFGDRDRWWGLLVEGFTEPNYRMFYHFPYYKNLFEAYGFKDYFQQHTFFRKVIGPVSEGMEARADRICKNPDYTFAHMQKNNLEKYAEDFRTIYNKAWVKHKTTNEFTKAQAMGFMKTMKPVLDEKIVWFAYYKNEPVAFFINLPELNQIFKHVNGKMDLIGKIKFLWLKLRKSNHKMFGFVFGVVPEQQGKGLEAAITVVLKNFIQTEYKQYEDFEMNWIGDFNPKMFHVAEDIGATVSKIHITYRKLFDDLKPFKRHPIIE